MLPTATRSGEALRNERLKRGWNQTRLADELDITQGRVSQLETGSDVMSIDFARHVEKTLGLKKWSLANLAEQDRISGGDSGAWLNSLLQPAA